MKKKIQIIITPEGEATVSVEGVKGGSCKDLTKALLHDLGGASHEKKTPEFFQSEQVKGQVKL
jgi:hypothetical protein